MQEYYRIGDENEADYVAQQSQIIWKETEGALDWLKKTYIVKSNCYTQSITHLLLLILFYTL